jgi:hypothetical protein
MSDADLESELEIATKTVATDSYSMSVGEMISMYREGEINIHPDFQRFFRWSPLQKSRLVESLLMGLPIPPIFVSQDEEGKWEVIDGLQRISTLLELAGDLKDRDGNKLPALTLIGTKYLPHLEGRSWEASSDRGQELSEKMKLRLRRARIDINIVLPTSVGDTKFELFDRLNTGGTFAEAQEVRSAMMIMANPGTFEWLNAQWSKAPVAGCFSLTDNQIDRQYHLDLLTRFIVLRRLSPNDAGAINDINGTLSQQMLALVRDSTFSWVNEAQVIDGVFGMLFEALHENAFRRFDVREGKHRGPFLLAAFEATALPLGARIDSGKTALDATSFSSAYEQLWTMHGTALTSVGKRASTRLKDTMSAGLQVFAV